MTMEHGSLWWIRPRDRSEPVVAVWDGGEGGAPAGWRVAGVVQEYVAMGLSDVLGPVLGWEDYHQALLAMKMTKRRLEAAISSMEEGFQGLVEAPDPPPAAKTAVPGVSNETVGIGGDPDGGGGGSGVTLTAGSGPERRDEKGKEAGGGGGVWVHYSRRDANGEWQHYRVTLESAGEMLTDLLEACRNGLNDASARTLRP